MIKEAEEWWQCHIRQTISIKRKQLKRESNKNSIFEKYNKWNENFTWGAQQ